MGAAEVIRVDDVSGWPLAIVKGEERPMVCQTVLAQRFEYADRKDVAALAKRVFGRTWISRARFAEIRTGKKGRPERDLLFTRREVIRLAMRCDASGAEAVQEEIADVFEMWLDGHLRPAGRADAEADLLAGLRDRGAVIRNLPLQRAKVQAAIFGAAKQCGRSWQWVEAQVRRAFDLRGYLSLRLPDVAAALDEIARVGQLARPPRLRHRPTGDKRQLDLFAANPLTRRDH